MSHQKNRNSTSSNQPTRTPSAQNVASFRRTVWKYYRDHGRRTLPWRTKQTPYRVLVSEVMLQQTQVPRVIEKFRDFMRRYPSARSLADAPQANVVAAWSGLGYNRRATFLHAAAKAIVREHGGRFPQERAALEALPGIGPYTAAAIRVFAFNEPEVLFETNVRTVFIHHFFPRNERVSDAQLRPLVEAAMRGQEPRAWYAAVMDYGSHLKRTTGNASTRSAHYIKQSRFAGSTREARGAVLKVLHTVPKTTRQLEKETGLTRERIDTALEGLTRDGLIQQRGKKWLVR